MHFYRDLSDRRMLAGVVMLVVLWGACRPADEAPATNPVTSDAVTPAVPAPDGNATALPDSPEGAAAALRDTVPGGVRPVSRQSELAGTSWRLVEIESMDGQKYVPDDRSKYTITFGGDGRASMRVDCNRGTGTWTSEERSHLTFGPIALTKMMCPQPSLHDRFARDLAYVRTYTMKDGHLFLSLMADGAIYEFEPNAQ